jgi:hypothetical protein
MKRLLGWTYPQWCSASPQAFVYPLIPAFPPLIAIQSRLFLHHILLHYLEAGRTEEAVTFATYYKELTFFAHALEILLHTIVEAEADLESIQTNPTSGVLPAVVEFLDHFDAALYVVVGCARKTEMTRWRRLFDIVGNPKVLFEVRGVWFDELNLCGVFTRNTLDMSAIGSLEDCWLVPSRFAQLGAARWKPQSCCPFVI